MKHGIPRRFTQHIKDLQRAGMDIVTKAPTGQNEMSEKSVEKVTGAVDKITGLGEKAEKVAGHVDQTIAEVDETLEIVQDMSAQLRRAGAALRGKLGVQTNRPPRIDTDSKGFGQIAGSGGGSASKG